MLFQLFFVQSVIAIRPRLASWEPSIPGFCRSYPSNFAPNQGLIYASCDWLFDLGWWWRQKKIQSSFLSLFPFAQPPRSKEPLFPTKHIVSRGIIKIRGCCLLNLARPSKTSSRCPILSRLGEASSQNSHWAQSMPIRWPRPSIMQSINVTHSSWWHKLAKGCQFA